ncbi:twin-arginine translocation signal domain-containing protein [Actibacterium sp. 188UL27-1]|nr:twin-arginine translocation signal domain-containing protein [Actibacterium sp. 188UL27-1]
MTQPSRRGFIGMGASVAGLAALGAPIVQAPGGA